MTHTLKLKILYDVDLDPGKQKLLFLTDSYNSQTIDTTVGLEF